MKKLLFFCLIAIVIISACRKTSNFTPSVISSGTYPTDNPPIISNKTIDAWFINNPVSQFLAIDWSKARQATIDGKNIVRVPTLNIDKSPGNNHLQVASVKTNTAEIIANYFPEHPPELFFIQDPKSNTPDSLYTMMVNFVPTDKNKDFGKDSIWTGKLYDWDLNSNVLHVQELLKSKVGSTYALVLNDFSSNAKNVRVNSFWNWLGGIVSDIWNAINYVAYYIGIPGAHIVDPSNSSMWLVQSWNLGLFFGDSSGGSSGGSSTGTGTGLGSMYSGQFFVDGVYSNYLPGYNGYYGSGWNPYPTGNPCGGGVNVASAGLKVQVVAGSGGPCDPPTVMPVIDYDDPQFDPLIPELLDTTGLSKYPTFKNIITNLPGFLQQYPNVLNALSYYTGFSQAKILRIMKPGAGPKVQVIKNLKSLNGVDVYGHYDEATKTLQINESLALGLDAANLLKTKQATALLIAITALHEFVHYGRDVNQLSSLFVDPQTGAATEAGWTFEANIGPLGGITVYTAIAWLNFYPYNF